MKIKYIALSVIVGFLAVFAATSSVRAQNSISLDCPTSINVGVRNIPVGWSDALFAAKNLPFSSASADATGKVVICEYGGYIISRPFPKSHTCTAQGRYISCSFVKPPPIKIPGKKTGGS